MHRARLSGVLELRAVGGPRAGSLHRVHLEGGLVTAAEVDLPAPDPYAEPATPKPPPVVMSRIEVQTRLDALYLLPDAELTFHVARARAKAEGPLTPGEFLHGRPRSRDRWQRPPPIEHVSVRARALAILGLSGEATLADVHRAFRHLARELHPDLHHAADTTERRALTEALVRVTQAYHAIVA